MRWCKKKKKGGGGWRQMYAERCRCEEGRESKERGGEAPVFKFFRFVVGFLLLLWEIKTNYITQLTCPLRFLRNCGSAWHWSASYKGDVGGWWCNASPLWGHASLSCQAESTLCTSTYRRPIIIISNGNTVNLAVVFIWYDNIFSKIGHKFRSGIVTHSDYELLERRGIWCESGLKDITICNWNPLLTEFLWFL